MSQVDRQTHRECATSDAFLCKVGGVDNTNIHRQAGRQTQSIVCTTSDASVFAVGGVIKVNINTQTGRQTQRKIPFSVASDAEAGGVENINVAEAAGQRVMYRETEGYFACCLASEAFLCTVGGVDNANIDRQTDTEKEYRVTHRETEGYFECILPLRPLCVQQVLLTMLTLTGRQSTCSVTSDDSVFAVGGVNKVNV